MRVIRGREGGREGESPASSLFSPRPSLPPSCVWVRCASSISAPAASPGRAVRPLPPPWSNCASAPACLCPPVSFRPSVRPSFRPCPSARLFPSVRLRPSERPKARKRENERESERAKERESESESEIERERETAAAPRPPPPAPAPERRPRPRPRPRSRSHWRRGGRGGGRRWRRVRGGRTRPGWCGGGGGGGGRGGGKGRGRVEGGGERSAHRQ